MAKNRGKDFESCVLNSFIKSFPQGTIDRIYDTQSYYKGISNVCDYIGFSKPNIYYIEAKSLKGNTFNVKKLTQYDKLIKKKDISGSVTGVVIWFIEHQKVVFVSIEDFEKLIESGAKSVNINKPETYSVIIPSVFKRIYPTMDFSILKNFVKNEEKQGE